MSFGQQFVKQRKKNSYKITSKYMRDIENVPAESRDRIVSLYVVGIGEKKNCY